MRAIKTKSEDGRSVTRWPAKMWFAMYIEYGDTDRQVIRNVNAEFRRDSQDGPSAGNVCTQVDFNSRRNQVVAVTSW